MADGMKFKIDLPIMKRVRVNREKALGTMGRTGAKNLRQNFSEGIDGHNETIKPPQDRGTPIDRTGTLIKSIKYVSRSARNPNPRIEPRGRRPESGPNSIKNQAGVMNWLMSPKRPGRNGRWMGGDLGDIMQPGPEIMKKVAEALNKNLVKQSRSKELGILHEIKTLYKKG